MSAEETLRAFRLRADACRTMPALAPYQALVDDILAALEERDAARSIEDAQTEDLLRVLGDRGVYSPDDLEMYLRMTEGIARAAALDPP